MEIQIPSLLRIKPDALHKLGKYLRKDGFDQICLLWGQGMKEIVGPTIEISLESAEIRIASEEVIDNNQVDAVFRSTFAVPRGTKALVAIGGGMAIDYAKYIAFMLHLPIVSVPTSISNDGFCSPMASLLVEGRRRSLKAKMPFGIILDTSVIAKSPAHFTLSGIGDLVSKYSAISDWKESYRKTGESVNDFAVMISLSATDALLNAPVQEPGNLDFLKTICSALVMSGVAMEVSGSSRPASGSEHLISHAYDRIAAKPSLHGLQVGLATLACLWLQNNPRLVQVRELLDKVGFVAWMKDHPLERPAFTEAIRMAPSIKEGYFTVLSQAEQRERLVAHVLQDPFWNEVLV